MTPEFDVYSYGIFAPSVLYTLQGEYPKANTYAEVSGIHESSGGEAAHAAYALARMGYRTKLDGNWLGNGEPEQRLVQHFTKNGVDCSRIQLKPNYEGIREIVISDNTTRTVFGSFIRLLFTEKQWNDPCDEDIRSARYVCPDPFFKDTSDLIVDKCKHFKVPFVGIDSKPDSPTCKNAEVLIISEEFIQREYPDADPQELFSEYIENCPGLCVMTFGSRPLWYARKGQSLKSLKPFPIDVKDTTGAGDCFRAGILHGLLQGEDDDTIIRYGSALAGYICETFPSARNSPSRDQFDAFLKRFG